jgi:hypothetical protein
MVTAGGFVSGNDRFCVMRPGQITLRLAYLHREVWINDYAPVCTRLLNRATLLTSR